MGRIAPPASVPIKQETKMPTEAENQERLEQGLEFTQHYLAANGLEDVRIDVDVYSPGEQWRRLVQNEEISPFWKYTGGTLNWLRYTVLPHRVFDRNDYDPFTNTLSLSSAKPLQGLYESAMAKEYLKRRNDLGVGSYAMLQAVPFVPLYHCIRASNDLLTYSDVHLDAELDREVYPMAWNRIASTAVSETLSVVTIAPDNTFFLSSLLRVAGGFAGRITGKALADQKYRTAAGSERPPAIFPPEPFGK